MPKKTRKHKLPRFYTGGDGEDIAALATTLNSEFGVHQKKQQTIAFRPLKIFHAFDAPSLFATQRSRRGKRGRQHKGGAVPKLIGQGTYGCVYRPPVTCRNNSISINGKITKLTTSKESVRELKEYSNMKSADPQNRYYLGVPETCVPELKSVPAKDLKSCDVYNSELKEKGALSPEDFRLIVMKDCGVDLTKLWKNIASRRKDLKTIWFGFVKLIKGIAEMYKSGIVHHDLKPQNIVYNAKTKDMNFIDFGLMKTVESMRLDAFSQKCRSRFHWSYPPETVFCCASDWRNTMKNKAAKFRELLIDPDDTKRQKQESLYGHFESATTLVNMIKPYFDNPENILKEYPARLSSFNSFFVLHAETFDIYGIGIAMAFVYAESKQSVANYPLEFEPFLFQCMHPCLTHRHTPASALAELQPLIQRIKIK